ncbi:MAG: hypothetical protein ACC655_11840, partial [Rhodothermia bacterium]
RAPPPRNVAGIGYPQHAERSPATLWRGVGGGAGITDRGDSTSVAHPPRERLLETLREGRYWRHDKNRHRPRTGAMGRPRVENVDLLFNKLRKVKDVARIGLDKMMYICIL